MIWRNCGRLIRSISLLHMNRSDHFMIYTVFDQISQINYLLLVLLCISVVPFCKLFCILPVTLSTGVVSLAYYRAFESCNKYVGAIFRAFYFYEVISNLNGYLEGP